MPGAEARRMHEEVLDHEDRFEHFLKRLDDEDKRTPLFKKILAEAEDSGDYESALQRLEDFYVKRRDALEKTTFKMVEGLNIDPEALQVEMRKIILAQGDQERLIGNGAVAEVFVLRGLGKVERSNGDICVKIVTDNERYGEGNTVEKEADFLMRLQQVEVAGVRTPIPLYSFSNLKIKGLVMEELDAFNFRRILEGKTTAGIKDEFPENFDLEDYFQRLKKYFEHLHSLGIFHGDIALRNMMINRKTGLPQVIDFGKARLATELDKTNLNLPDYAKSDLAALESAKIEAKQAIEALANKGK